MEKKMDIKGMHCKSCALLLSDVISEIGGVESVSVDFKSGKAVVVYSDESVLAKIRSAVEKEGYSVV